jgi:putative FmdB family regulatory protein
MPIYEFRCEKCDHVMEALRQMGQGPKGLACPECGSRKLEQVFSTFAASSGGSVQGAPPCGAPSCGQGSGSGFG